MTISNKVGSERMCFTLGHLNLLKCEKVYDFMNISNKLVSEEGVFFHRLTLKKGIFAT